MNFLRSPSHLIIIVIMISIIQTSNRLNADYGAGVRSDLAIKIYGDDFEKLLPIANKLATVLIGVRGASNEKSNR